MGRCPGWWGEGGVETMRQEPEPSHTALSTKSLMLILLTQHRPTVFILYTFRLCCLDYKCSGPSPQVVPVPITVSVIPHPVPPLPFCGYPLFSVQIISSSKKKRKAKASLHSSYLLIPFVSCYSLLRAGTLPDHRDPSSPGVPFAPGTLAGISEVPPQPPLTPSLGVF